MDPRNTSSGPMGEQNAAQKVSDKVNQVVGDIRSKDPQTLASDARNAAMDAADTARQRGTEIADQAAVRANDAMTAAGDQMTNLAQTVREKAPGEGRAGEIATTAADALERSGRYLQQADPNMVRTDLERVIREHPIEAMLVGLGIGYLLARATRR